MTVAEIVAWIVGEIDKGLDYYNDHTLVWSMGYRAAMMEVVSRLGEVENG